MWSRPDRFANKETEKNLSWEVPKQRALLIKANSVFFDHYAHLMSLFLISKAQQYRSDSVITMFTGAKDLAFHLLMKVRGAQRPETVHEMFNTFSCFFPQNFYLCLQTRQNCNSSIKSITFPIVLNQGNRTC